MFTKTFLLDKNRDNLLFRKEVAPVIKIIVLLAAIVCFLLSIKVAWAKTSFFKGFVVFFSLLALCVIGAKSDFVFDRARSILKIETKFFFYKRTREFSFTSFSLQVNPEVQSMRIIIAEQSYLLTSKESPQTIENWEQVISSFLTA